MLPGAPLDGSCLNSESSWNHGSLKGAPAIQGVPFSLFQYVRLVEFFRLGGTRERSRLQISLEVGQRFRHVFSSIAKPDVVRFVVDRARKQQHACIAD